MPNNPGQVAYANAVLETISVPEPNGLVGGLAALVMLVRRDFRSAKAAHFFFHDIDKLR